MRSSACSFCTNEDLAQTTSAASSAQPLAHDQVDGAALVHSVVVHRLGALVAWGEGQGGAGRGGVNTGEGPQRGRSARAGVCCASSTLACAVPCIIKPFGPVQPSSVKLAGRGSVQTAPHAGTCHCCMPWVRDHTHMGWALAPTPSLTHCGRGQTAPGPRHSVGRAARRWCASPAVAPHRQGVLMLGQLRAVLDSATARCWPSIPQ